MAHGREVEDFWLFQKAGNDAIGQVEDKMLASNLG